MFRSTLIYNVVCLLIIENLTLAPSFADSAVIPFSLPEGRKLKIEATFSGPWEEEVRIFDDQNLQNRIGSLGSWNGRDSVPDTGPKAFVTQKNPSRNDKTYYVIGYHKRDKATAELDWFADLPGAHRIEQNNPGKKMVIRCDTYTLVREPRTVWADGPDGKKYPQTIDGPPHERPTGAYDGMRVELTAIE